jgi:DNA-binding transcriptional LysR family regulator
MKNTPTAMDHRSLTCFVALAEELHFGRAAARAHISQPGLSQQLRRLEQQHQVHLVNRSKRHVSLTLAGEVVLVEARKILRAMDQAVELTQQTQSGVVGHLSVGVTASALFVALPEILSRFKAELPDVNVMVHDMTTAEQELALLRGDIHVGLVHPPLSDAHLASTEIARVPFDVVMSDKNPLARRRRLTFKDLAGERLILFPRAIGPRLYDEIIAMCHQAGFSPDIIEASPVQSIVALAACNLGVGLVAFRVQHYGRSAAVFRSLSGEAPQLTLGVAHLPTTQSVTVAKFIDAAVKVGDGLV